MPALDPMPYLSLLWLHCMKHCVERPNRGVVL